VKFPASAKLEGAEMAKFRNIKTEADRTYASLTPTTKVAQAEDEDESTDKN
jgi:hypothetical protein